MRHIALSAILIVLLLVQNQVVFADRGSIPFIETATVFEPNQRALIAWDGKEEILILTTNLMASEPTKVLEVIPLPSEPAVTEGDIEIFKKATDLINEKTKSKRPLFADNERGAILGGSAKSAPAGRLTFHDVIGAHDVSVAEVLNGAGFVAWVNNYLKSQQVQSPSIPSKLKDVIEEYIRDGYSWFVFDVVQLETTPKTNQAIQYRFKSEKLFYPLKISKTDSGYTTIDLMILTPKLLGNFPSWPKDKVQLMHEPISLTYKEINSLSKEICELMFKNPANNEHSDGNSVNYLLKDKGWDVAELEMKLRIWRIQWKLEMFDSDLIAF